jgi:hypothetical protein
MPSASFITILFLGVLFVLAVTAYEIARSRRDARARFGLRVGRVTRRADHFILALALLSCVSTGLSQTIGRKAPVSAFFCVQTTVTPSPLPAPGWQVEIKDRREPGTPPRVPIARENPGVGFDAITQTIGSMSSKKKGPARPDSAAYVRRVSFLLADAVAVELINSRREYVGLFTQKTVAACVRRARRRHWRRRQNHCHRLPLAHPRRRHRRRRHPPRRPRRPHRCRPRPPTLTRIP